MKLELLVAEKNFEGASGVGHLVGEGGPMCASGGRSLVGGFDLGGGEYKWAHMAPKNGFGL